MVAGFLGLHLWRTSSQVVFAADLYQVAEWLTRWALQISGRMIQDGKRGAFAMGQPIAVRTDYTVAKVLLLAKQAKDAAQARRLLASAAARRELADRGGDECGPGPPDAAGRVDPFQRAGAGRSGLVR